MSQTIDQKVVEMRFENENFERNVATSMTTLDKLKQNLNFKGASTGISQLEKSANKVDMSSLANGVEKVSSNFSALEVIGVTSLAKITSSAIDTASTLIKSLSSDQIFSGWNKYEQEVGYIQTIMNATGKTEKQVNKYLDELSWFSDETSYGLTDMMAALSTMVSSGGDIENLTSLITGVANATAFAGKGANEFKRIMYNINQSYSQGFLSLQDWKSVELAGAASEQLKKEIIKAGEALGEINIGDVTTGTFANSLKDKWVTREVMERAYGRFAAASKEAYKLVQQGAFDTAAQAYDYLESQVTKEFGELKTILKAGMKDTADNKQIAEIQKILKEKGYQIKDSSGIFDESTLTAIKEFQKESKLAIDGIIGPKTWAALTKVNNRIDDLAIDSARAAQQAKTFTEAIVATQDAVSSKWKETFKIIFGGYEESKSLWGDFGDSLWELFVPSGIQRNKILQAWKDLGGRDDLIAGFTNIVDAVINARDAIKGAFQNIFPPMTGEKLASITKQFRIFTEYLNGTRSISELTNKAIEKLSSAWQYLKNAVEQPSKVLSDLQTVFKNLTSNIQNSFPGLIKWATELYNAVSSAKLFQDAVKIISDILGSIGECFSNTTKQLVEFVKGLDLVKKGLTFLEKPLNSFQSFLDGISKKAKGAKKEISIMGNSLSNSFKMGNDGGYKSINLNAAKTLSSFGDSKNLNSSGAIKTLGSLDSIGSKGHQEKDVITASKNFGQTLLKALRDVLDAIVKDLPALFDTAILGMVTHYIVKLLKSFKSTVEPLADIKTAIVGVLDGIKDSMTEWQNSIKASIFKEIASSLLILAGALLVMSFIPADKLLGVVGAVSALFTELLLSFKLVASTSKELGKLSVIAGTFVGISIAMLILASALKKVSSIQADRLTESMYAFTIIFSELFLFIKNCPTTDIAASGVALWGLAKAMLVMATALKVVSTITKNGGDLWGAVGALGIMVAILTGSLMMLKDGVPKGLGATMLGIAASLILLAVAIRMLCKINTMNLLKSIGALGSGLAILTIVLNNMKGTIGGSAALLIAANALIVLAGAMALFGVIPMDTIWKGLFNLAASFIVLAAGLTVMEGCLNGAKALGVAGGALIILAAGLALLGSIPLEMIGIGLLAIAGTFAVLGLAALVLTPVVPVIFLLAQSLLMVGAAAFAIGAALILAGTGLGMMAAGLSAVAAAGVGALAALIAAIQQLFTDENGILGLLASLFESVLTLINEHLPTIIDTVLSLITGILEAIANNIQPIVEAGIEIVLGLIRGISEKMDDITQAGFDLLISFIDGISKSIDENFNDLMNSVLNLITTIIDSVIEFLTGGAVTDFCASGKAVIDGFIKGMGDMIDSVVQKAKDIAKAAVRTVKGWLGIESPSKVFRKIGVYTGEGLALGLEDSENSIANSAIGIGKTAKIAMEKAINGMSDIVNGIDTQPTIRPILDLSDIESGATRIDKLSNSWNGYSIDGTVNLAKTTMGSLPLQPNSTSLTASMLEQIKKLGNTMSGEKKTTITNNFSITGDNPREIANEVSRILQQQVERRDAVWA